MSTMWLGLYLFHLLFGTFGNRVFDWTITSSPLLPASALTFITPGPTPPSSQSKQL